MSTPHSKPSAPSFHTPLLLALAILLLLPNPSKSTPPPPPNLDVHAYFPSSTSDNTTAAVVWLKQVIEGELSKISASSSNNSDTAVTFHAHSYTSSSSAFSRIWSEQNKSPLSVHILASSPPLPPCPTVLTACTYDSKRYLTNPSSSSACYWVPDVELDCEYTNWNSLLGIVTITFTVATAIYLVNSYRKNPPLPLSQPLLTQTFTGFLISSLFLNVLYLVPSSAILCNLRTCLFNVTFTAGYGILCLKSWRVRVLWMGGFKARKVTNPMLWRRLLLLCAFDFIILGLSVAFKWTEYEHEVDLRGGAHYSVCISDSHVGTVVSLLFKMALVAWGVRLSYGTETLPTPSTSESRGIREATILAGIGCVAYMVIWTLGILDGKYGGLVRGALVCSVAGFGGGRMFKKNGAAAEEEAAASFSTTRLTTARLTTAKFTTTRLTNDLSTTPTLPTFLKSGVVHCEASERPSRANSLRGAAFVACDWGGIGDKGRTRFSSPEREEGSKTARNVDVEIGTG
ncbi:hypothetical protein TrVE_jg12411 [Triparma verrucosa]|uniref:G-protein coupled receptors family 3 profile domain-containing protein n=1 Tax=Triparma verrucosa TaxID=1606542 RepID=A0A9W7CID7_9STRA|nr:hypothetical protein TrVE_jg12411 [Triparma verrucosa]